MAIDRRDLLKALSTTTIAAALEGVWSEEAPPQAKAASQAGQRAEGSKSPVEGAPECLIQAEPVVTLDPDGKARIEWETVIPTQGGTIYVGLPNDEVALDWPIYNASQAITEESARLKHAAQVDVHGFATRSAARMLAWKPTVTPGNCSIRLSWPDCAQARAAGSAPEITRTGEPARNAPMSSTAWP